MYVVHFHQLYRTKNMVNSFFYRPVTGDGLATELLDEFVTDVVPKINAIQEGTVVTNRLVQVFHLFDPTNFVEDTITGGGVRAGGGSLPARLAVNYTLRLDTRAIRPGKKRFSGIGKDYVTEDVISDATYIGFLQTLKGQLATELTGSSTAYKPCVVRRVEEPATATHDAYFRLPEVTGELEYGDITVALVNLTVTTQNSRKD